MSRRFPDFLTAYREYADDGFVPPQFNVWSGLSIIAGALERRVWLPWNDSYSFYPNIYVLLVSMPGDGKSVALNKAVGLLMDAARKSGGLNVMPNQVTEAKFIELMGRGRNFLEVTLDGRELHHVQNAGYYWASEASNSLKNVFGDFIACLTDFYDCPPTWARATKKDGKPIQLINVCMNLIAGSTFDYLGKLVSDENIMGGFASRLIYVVSKNKEVQQQQFQLGGMTNEEKDERRVYRDALVEDLVDISKVVGAMRASPEFARAWEAWYPAFEKKRRALESEKAQSLIARVNTNALKVAMLMCASESSDRELKLHHWEKALELVLGVQEKTPAIFRQAKATGTERTHGSLQASIIHYIVETPGITVGQLTHKLTMNYSDKMVIQVINAMIGSKVLASDNGKLRILGDPNNHL